MRPWQGSERTPTACAPTVRGGTACALTAPGSAAWATPPWPLPARAPSVPGRTGDPRTARARVACGRTACTRTVGGPTVRFVNLDAGRERVAICAPFEHWL